MQNLRCGAVQRELSCICVRCSMRTRFADTAQHADTFFAIRAISTAWSARLLLCSNPNSNLNPNPNPSSKPNLNLNVN